MNLIEWVSTDLRGLDGIPLPNDRLPTLQQLLLALDSESSIESVKRMRSRKNVVLRIDVALSNGIEQSYVAKLFVTDSFEKEIQILRNCLEHGLKVPEVVGADSGVCLMEFIEGNLLVDQMNQTFDDNLVTMIAEWYYEFHRKLGMTKGDPRLRNFIVTREGLFGLDFEEAGKGHWMKDVAGIAASILDTDPIYHQQKKRLVWLLLEEYLGLLGEVRNNETDTSFVKTVADVLEKTARHRNDERVMDVSRDIRVRGIPID